MSDCAALLPLDDLIDYHLGALGPDREAAVEDHYFACAACTARLEIVVQLGTGIVEAVRAGRIFASVTHALLARGASRGLKVRSYRVGAGEQVACTADPTDDFVAIRLGLDVERAEHIDIEVEWTAIESGATGERMLADVALDRTAREVVLLFPGDEIRGFPRSEWRMQAVLRDPAGETRRGPFVLQHTPWAELQPAD